MHSPLVVSIILLTAEDSVTLAKLSSSAIFSTYHLPVIVDLITLEIRYSVKFEHSSIVRCILVVGDASLSLLDVFDTSDPVLFLPSDQV